ncbi:hypothetical protein NCCP1664_11440 [Zafaria cholistanensis]|uniref:Acyl-CoA carboxylase subunit epsilon n=1 Tax=Zafaria cholistanensis TaxID=1682741 RepID=A0A5A7NRP0_9MICC|nr:acyl-CoA carboxylase subunit epsilon [Zafaria cholistanensis]GER22647.1 hypothetical protein NCCP1664_11440 [Zafaria cholistanensis]
MATTDTQPEPLFRVERGNPTPEEIAALAAVVLCLQSGTEPEPAAPTRGEQVRRGFRRGRQMATMPGAWRSGRA